MPRKEGVTSLDVPIGELGRSQIKTAAAEAGYKSMADYVRDLIRRDIEARGLPFDDGLTEWGMGRKKKATKKKIEQPDAR